MAAKQPLKPTEAFVAEVDALGLEDRNAKLINRSIINKPRRLMTLIYDYERQDGKRQMRWAIYIGNSHHASASGILYDGLQVNPKT